MRVAIIGVPMDLGGRRRGTDMGPSAIRYAGLYDLLRALGHEVRDMGNVPVAVRETRAAGDERAKYAQEVVNVCRHLSQWVSSAVRQGYFPLVLGGDHSIAMGTVSGLVRELHDIGLIWLDAHGDFNTPETTPSGSIHGMPLAVITGRGHPSLIDCAGGALVPEERIALVGVRDLDPGEREALRASRITVMTMRDVDERGIGPVMRKAAAVASQGGRYPVHLTMDIDAIDPTDAPGVGSPERGGLTYREAHLAMEILAEEGVVASMELTEVNPILDQGNRTAGLAMELVASVLGKTII